MRFQHTVILACLWMMAMGPPAQAQTAERLTELRTEEERWSYAVGMRIGRTMLAKRAMVSLDVLFQAIRDVLDEEELLLTDEEAAAARQAFREHLQSAWDSEAGEKNRREGAAFLAENATRDSVVTTASGLQYMVLVEGDGPSPQPGQRVMLHHRGMLVNGKEFTNSYAQGEPTIVELDKLLPGWVEALRLMKVGSRYRIFVPSELAYGEKGFGVVVRPHAVLIYELELLGILD